MLPHSLPRPLHSRHGAVTPLAVLNLSLLVGVVALVVDGGTLMEARRHVQAATDAAALAGAADLFVNYPANQGIDVKGSAQTSALTMASANGFVNDGVQSTVSVRTSPQNYQGGPYAGKTIPAGYVEVVIQYNANHLFSGVFGSGTTPVSARAVARGRCAPLISNAVTLLSLSGSAVLSVSGSGGFVVNGGIQINSSSSLALNVSAVGGVTASRFTLNPAVASLLGSIGSLLSGPNGSSPTTCYSPPIPDPLRYLPAPNPAQLSSSQLPSPLRLSSGTHDLYPGVYSGGILVSSAATVILHANANGTPGIYYLQGQNGFQVSGSASVTTAANEAGVLIYNDWADVDDTLHFASSGSITLTPPASGPYQGLTFFQKRGSPASLAPPVFLGGTGSINVTGTFYAAYASVSLASSLSSNVLAGQVVADSLTVTASANVNINRGSQSVANLRLLGLVE